MNVTRFSTLAATFAVLVALTGCGSINTCDRDTAIGAVVGGVAGSAISGGSTVGTVGGAVAGGVVGKKLRC